MQDLESATEGLRIVAQEDDADDEWEENTAHVDWNVINWEPEASEPSDPEARSETLSAQEESEGEILEEMSEEDLLQLQILSGERSALQWADILETRHEKAIQELEKQYLINGWPPAEKGNEMLELLTRTLELEIDFKLKLFYVKEAVETQIKQATTVAAIPNKRSQQYQDTLAANIDSKDHLTQLNKDINRRRNILQHTIRGLREHEDVTRTDHPRHKELLWTACDTDTCPVHYYAKMDGYFPKNVKPVYWPAKGMEHLEAPIPGDEPSKN